MFQIYKFSPPNPSAGALISSNQLPSPTTIAPLQVNTFPTLINFVSTSTAMPPSVAPPWAFSSAQPPNSQFTTAATTIVTKGSTSLGPNTVVESTSQRKKAVLPPPNKFMTG